MAYSNLIPGIYIPVKNKLSHGGRLYHDFRNISTKKKKKPCCNPRLSHSNITLWSLAKITLGKRWSDFYSVYTNHPRHYVKSFLGTASIKHNRKSINRSYYVKKFCIWNKRFLIQWRIERIFNYWIGTIW